MVKWKEHDMILVRMIHGIIKLIILSITGSRYHLQASKVIYKLNNKRIEIKDKIILEKVLNFKEDCYLK